MVPRVAAEKLAKKLRGLPEEYISEQNTLRIERTAVEWDDFCKAFKVGTCYLCSKSLKTFSEHTPCLHWLMRPKGFKKKHFKLIYENFEYFRLESYIRWVASIDGHIKNINDLKPDNSKDIVFEFTAQHRHIKWSISCKQSDLDGHKSSRHSNFPHYHFQMRLDNQAFIDYGDYHIPFHDDDLLKIELFRNHSDLFKTNVGPGAGIRALLDNDEGLNLVVDTSEPTDDVDGAAFEISTIIEAPEGEKLSGEDLYNAFQEAKATRRTATAVFRDRFPRAKVTAYVSPGKGVPEAMPRTRNKKD